jgi:site-specific DNA-methyltransferase (adenine-specific)
MEFMARYPDKYFDMTIVDQPYNVGIKYNSHDDNMPIEKYREWCFSWFDEVFRVSNAIVMTPGMVNLWMWSGRRPKHLIIWHKPNQNSPSPIGGFNAYEPILFWGKNLKKVGHDIFTSSIALQNDVEWHPCPKHLNSWKKIINLFVNAPAILFDPFLGSGSSRIAAYDMGFDFYGCELDQEYFDASCKRFERFKAQGKLDLQVA